MLLFVYGSLKRDEYNHGRFGFNNHAHYLSAAESSEIQLYQIPDVTYPHAVLEHNQNAAKGEIYQLNLSNEATAEMFSNILLMELNVGYCLVEIRYTIPQSLLQGTAFAFVATQRLAQLLRDPIYQATPITEWKGPRNEI